jgi:hypothetical protein
MVNAPGVQHSTRLNKRPMGIVNLTQEETKLAKWGL